MLSGGNTQVRALYIHKLLYSEHFLFIVFKFTHHMYRYKNNISVFTIYYTSGIYKSIYIYTVYRRTISRLWSCCFGGFGADHRVIWNRPQPDWTPSSFMFVILGPAPLDLDLDGGTETDVSLWAVAGRPSSSLTVVHTTSSWFPFTFRTLCHRTAVGKKRNNVRNPLLKDVITWNLKLMLLMGDLESETDLIFR